MKALIYLLAFLSLPLLAQVPISETNFRAPMNIKMILAGNFAEMRSNHFHTGLDIKTNGKEGYRIYAIDSGYVSRINISHWGYGKALYITHPNGYTSVYAHLSKFPKHIEEYIRKKQFSKKSETVQLYPKKSEIPVSKGEIVAFSGNSGSSSAPHLHFEIRETESENPVNPLLFKFDITDTKKPVLLDVKLYPKNGAKVNGKSKEYNLDLEGSDGKYKRKYTAPVNVCGEVGFAINTIDYLNDARNKCGIYTIEMKVDGIEVFKQKLDKLDFSTNRYINTHSDYLEYRLNKQSYHKTFKSSNNKLEIYELINGDGYINFKDSLKHKISFIVKDVYGNTSKAQFEVQSLKSDCQSLKLDGEQIIKAKENNVVKHSGFEAELPRNTVYEDLKYELKQQKAYHSATPVYSFHNDHIPVQKYFVLKIKTQGIPNNMLDKALVVELSKDRRRAYAKGGELDNGYLKTEVRSFGDYTIKIDSVKPVITSINVSNNKQFTKSQSLQYKISDNLSGIESYNVFVDEEWKLANYVPKKATLSLPLAGYNKIGKGKHQVRVEVVDERGNKSELKHTIIVQ